MELLARWLFHSLETESAVSVCVRVEHPRANVVSERFTDEAAEGGGVGHFLVQIFARSGRAQRDPTQQKGGL